MLALAHSAAALEIVLWELGFIATIRENFALAKPQFDVMSVFHRIAS